MGKTYYQVLGVSQTDTHDAIRKVYRQLAKENHPDLHPGDAAAEERFKEINEAWEILGDNEKRKAYDEELASPKGARAGQKGPKSPDQKVHFTAEDVMNFTMGFDDYFNPANQGVGKKQAGAGPVDTANIFKQVFGFDPNKKK